MAARGGSRQFSDPLLVAAYDTLNALGADRDFWCAEVERLSPSSIVDLGCGTGLLTCELARRGYEMTGVDPSGAMLDIARRKPDAGSVRWIEGGYQKLEGLRADLILMTSHVAQFFLDGKEWKCMLEAAHCALHPRGHIVFDSRTPIFPPYRTWPVREAPKRVEDAALGPIDWWYKLLEIQGSRVRYELHYHFIRSDEKITSTDELVFRSREELTESLEGAGFEVQTVYGDWNGDPATPTSPEMIFVAVRR